MKGVVARCLEMLVREKFGNDKWEAILEKSGLDKNTTISMTGDIDDPVVLKVVDSTCKVLGINLLQAADAFGEYWVCTFAPKIYGIYYSGAKSAKEFLLKMDEVHSITTQRIPNAKPPRFEYQWTNDKTLVMKYKSQRNLIDFLVGLIKGVGKYFKENLTVTKLGSDRVQIIFP